MNQSRSVILAGVVALVAVIGGWIALPYLQKPEDAVNREVSLHVERARRLLHDYDARLTYAVMVREQLRAADVDVDAEEPSSFADRHADLYQSLHGALWSSFEPTNWAAEVPRPDRPSYGNIAGEVRTGVRAYDDLASENGRLLNDALAEINKALAVTIKDASGRSSAHANHLKAVILQQQALAGAAQAALKRNEAATPRGELIAVSAEVGDHLSRRSLAADSGIQTTIETVRDRIAETQASLREKQEELADLQRTISELESRHAAAEAEAEEARVALESLEARGVRFADPQGGEAFSQQMLALSEAYTRAMRLTHMLEHGGYPNAQIDYSGDYLRGRYLENGQPGNLTVNKGLRQHRLDHEILSEKVAIEQQSLQTLNDDLAEFERTLESHAAAERESKARLAELKEVASEEFAILNQVQSEAFAIEERALGQFNESANLLQQAARLSEQWASDARQRTQSMTPETQARSAFQTRMDDGWMAGNANAEIAGVQLAKAWIHYDRYRAASRDAEAIAGLTDGLPLEEADASSEKTKADNARRGGIEEIKQAMASLQNAHRSLNSHWTVSAQSAGTVYLLALFGDSDYVADAVQHYRNAIKGRESEPFVQAFTARLAELERRPGGSASP